MVSAVFEQLMESLLKSEFSEINLQSSCLCYGETEKELKSVAQLNETKWRNAYKHKALLLFFSPLLGFDGFFSWNDAFAGKQRI